MRSPAGFVVSSIVVAAIGWAAPARAKAFSKPHVFVGPGGVAPQALLVVDAAGPGILTRSHAGIVY